MLTTRQKCIIEDIYKEVYEQRCIELKKDWNKDNNAFENYIKAKAQQDILDLLLKRLGYYINEYKELEQFKKGG